MTDVFSKGKRSWIMSRVRGADTRPERIIRSFLHTKGFRFRLHVSKLPGKPDIVLPKHKTLIFVNGCFWHGHRRCRRASIPTTRTAFWRRKILGNMTRDKHVQRLLRKKGWEVLTVWECQVRKPEQLQRSLASLLARED